MDNDGFKSARIKILTRSVNTICLFFVFFCFLTIIMPRSSVGFEALVNQSSTLESLWIIIPMMFSVLVVIIALFLLLRNYRAQKILKARQEAQQKRDMLNMPLEQYGSDKGATVARPQASMPVQNFSSVSAAPVQAGFGSGIAAAQEAQIKHMIDGNAAERAKYEDLANQALQAGREDDYRVFTAKKQSLEAAGAALNAAYSNTARIHETQERMMGFMQNMQTSRTINVNTIVMSNGKIINQTSYASMPQDNTVPSSTVSDATPKDEAEALAEKYSRE